MNVVIIGMGEVGKHISFMLALDNHNIIIIDSNPETLASAEEKMDVMALGGHGCSPKTLKNAMIHNADLVVSVTNNDEINLLAANLSKNLGAKKSIARVIQKDYLPYGKGFYENHLGADLVISPNVLTAMEIIKVIKSSKTLLSHHFAENKIELLKIGVPDKSKFQNQSISSIKLPDLVKIVAIVREGEVIREMEEELLEAGDHFYLIGTVKQLKKLEKSFEFYKDFKNKKVMLVGGEDIALEIAEELEQLEIQTVLIDSDKDHCDYLAERLSKTSVICGDATNPAFLREEHINDFDVFVALSPKDEINLMTALLAKREGVPKTIALTQKSGYLTIYEQLGIDVTISPRMIAANQILKFVKKGDVVNLMYIEESKYEVLEYSVHSDSKITGKQVADINFPFGVDLLFINKHNQGIEEISEATLIEDEDTLIFISELDDKKALERLFKRKSLLI